MNTVVPVRREDRETVGQVRGVGEGAWVAETVFGAALGDPEPYDAAVATCRRDGMAALAAPWWRDGPDGMQQVWLLEVHPDRLVVSTLDPRYGTERVVLDPARSPLRRRP